MKRALCLLVLVAACSHSSNKAAPTPTPTESPTPTVTSGPTATPTTAPPTPTPTVAPFTGPQGTKVPHGFHPMSASWISASTGFVLGASPCPSGKSSCDVIARTLDGGKSWRAIPSPRTSPDHLAQIRMADARNGFVTGDQLWITHDGGATWKAQGGSVNELAIAAGRAWTSTATGLQSAPVTTGVFVQEKVTSEVASFSVHGSQVIYGAADSPGIQTVEHGAKPTNRGTPCKDGQSAVPVEGTSTHWFVVCEGEAGLGHQEKTAFESFDAGRTWKAAGSPPPATGTDLYVTTDGTFVFDHQTVAVHRGGTWSTALDTDGGMAEGGFESARLGYCIGGFGDSTFPAMKITHDAGRTWAAVAF